MTLIRDRTATDTLETRAMHMAALHKARYRTEERPRLLSRLKTHRLLLHDAYLLFVRIAEEEGLHSFAAEWLLDNYYIVQAALRQIVEDLPEKYYRQLPRLEATRLAGMPRVYAIARELVFSQDARVDLAQVEIFINAYQNVTPLTMGELWAIPIMLRFTLIEALTQAATQALDIQALDEGAAIEELPQGVTPDTIIANSITSLRAISVYNWKDFFERSSLVERILTGDPTRTYSRMDFETRNAYRSEIERLSFETSKSQVEIARQVVALARYSYAQDWQNTQKSHVGYYLISRGRGQLEQALKYQPAGLKRLRCWMEDHPTRAYLLSIAGLTELILALVVLAAILEVAVAGQALLILALALIPTTALAVSLVNWGVMQILPPRHLPRLDFSSAVNSSDTSGGIPANCRTAVVIPALLSSQAEVESLLAQLEQHYLRNDDPNLAFGLLTDFNDAPQSVMPGDEVLVQRALAGLVTLQQKYSISKKPAHFFFLHRERRWNPAEGVWMGWERKRGKLEEFNRLLSGQQETSFFIQAGSLPAFMAAPGGVRYVITLDADTVLPTGSAAALVGTLAHPLNTATFKKASGKVTSGYTILQPRTEIKPESANQTHFTRIFAGDSGFDLYTLAVSDVYQDLFGEGIYVGKGIYDVQAFRRSLEGQIPENVLLSHDLLEGLLGRAGLVSNIVLYESYPPTYSAYLNRLTRWIRGDWQLLPWLIGLAPTGANREYAKTQRRLSPIASWKITDNLRRSLYPIAVLLLLVAGWLWLPGSPLAWSLFALLTTLGSPLTSLAGRLLRPRIPQPDDGQDRPVGIAPSDRNQAMRWLLSLVFLPHEALQSFGAILTTLVRLLFSERRLLEWATSASVAQSVESPGDDRLAPWRKMAGTLLLSAALLVVLILYRPTALLVALPFLLAWLSAPQISIWLNQPVTHQAAPLSAEETLRLRRLARRTWYFFERFVGPTDHWLPPDHFQESPRGEVAHRTSTTNIGLGLISTLAAYDLGYTGLAECLLRLGSTINTLDELVMVRGHYLNWYDTRTLQPLTPRYISTVDNGNLAGSMLALRQGLSGMIRQPLVRWQRWEGLLDTVGVFRETLATLTLSSPQHSISEIDALMAASEAEINAAKDQPDAWPDLLNHLLCNSWPAVQRHLLRFIDDQAASLSPRLLQSLHIWVERILFHLSSMDREIRQVTPWTYALANPPMLIQQIAPRTALSRSWIALSTLLSAQTCPECLISDELDIRRHIERIRTLLVEEHFLEKSVQETLDWCDSLSAGFDNAIQAARELIEEIERLTAWLDRSVAEMNFRFLYNPQRHIFHIGYNVDIERMDNSYYDLLASESRIASLIAIAKGDVAQRHWLHLNRPLTFVQNELALLSWSGTLFEYLMPPLLLREYPNTLLNQSAYTAIRYQIAYAAEKKVPWGISESGFYYFDANQNYQYRAFGVPRLGFKRGLADDLVITPYASLLALPFCPQEVIANLQRLDELEMLTDYGYYEAIDFTPSRLPLGQEYARVASFMAHHQGMILLALVNQLQDHGMVERFHANPLIKSVEMLLQEQIPQNAVIEQVGEDDETPPIVSAEPPVLAAPWPVPVENALPRVHYLSNGAYSLLITNHGSGYSSWQGSQDAAARALTRWRADTTQDDWGAWIYLQDLDSGHFWTAGAQLLPAPDGLNATFSAHKADFHGSAEELNLHLQITVHPQDDIEIRLLRISNSSDRPRRIALTSYGELVLTTQDADRRHPAFNKLIIESEYEPGLNALFFHRRPRAATDPHIYLSHALLAEPGRGVRISYESDRAKFLGRGRTVRNPLALQPDGPGLTNTTGPVLDPIFSLRSEFTIQPNASLQVAFLTAAAGSRQDLLALGRCFSDWGQIESAFDQARYAVEVEIRRLQSNSLQNGASLDFENYQALLSGLLYPQPGLRAAPGELAANNLGQPGLWAFGISGDYPILLLTIAEREELSLLREILPAHALWRNRGLLIDLVILTENQSGYGQEVHDRVYQTLLHSGNTDWLNRRGGIFMVKRDQIDDAEVTLLQTAARAILSSQAGSLASQVRILEKTPLHLPGFIPVSSEPVSEAETPVLARPTDLHFDNGWGGFTQDGREYQIYLQPGRPTPAPWINVIANAEAGFWVSETGGGYTWAANSGENRLTPWSNDPVSDTTGEALYLRDEESTMVWSPTPLPASQDQPFLVRHGAGYTIFEHHSYGLRQELCLFMARDLPVKIIHLRLENLWQRPRSITATYYAEWVLGVNRDQSQLYILPDYDNAHRALLARNPYNVEFGQRVAFLAASQNPHGLTSDRTEFLGQSGSYTSPAGLQRVGLSGQVRAGVDPCAALQIHIDLPPGQTVEVYFLLGQGEDRAAALACIEQLASLEQVQAAFEEVSRDWDERLGALQVETPEHTLDLVLNRWLMYQNLSCRIWGRSALYQSSGAYGFRDQLQDVMALLLSAPQIAREHIVRTAHYQFTEGDVLHWWHPPSGRGVRTRHSDDLLWLPYVTAEYLMVTGEAGILAEAMPFLTAEPLREDEEDRYGLFPASTETYPLYEHCLRAIRHASTAGPHGLPLFGAGDWNDGMNRVGAGGRGESVWMGWFLFDILERFTPICRAQGDDQQAKSFQQQAADLRTALQAHAWDGEWYLRGFYDSGHPLGSAQSEECQIDSLAQSWAVLSGAGDPLRNLSAMNSLLERLVQPEGRLVRLFIPAFDQTEHDPGYIKAYPPGVRENGGQYTHAALWAVWAFTQLGEGNTAGRLFHLLNPITHGDTPESAASYRVEPYVIAADVYSEPPHVGRGGWTWYTGSSGWMYRLGVEAILGLRRRGDHLLVDPCIPSAWPRYQLHWQLGDTRYHIRVNNPQAVESGVVSLTLDGRDLPDRIAPLLEDGLEHTLIVNLGPGGSRPSLTALPIPDSLSRRE